MVKAADEFVAAIARIDETAKNMIFRCDNPIFVLL